MNDWLAANKTPGATHAPLAPPTAASPATLGGGVIQAGAGAHPGPGTPPQVAAKGMTQPGPNMPAPSPQPQPQQSPIPPQYRQAIMAALSGQRAG